MLDQRSEQQLFDQVEQCYQLCENKLKRHFPRPSIGFKLRGQNAGAAHLSDNKLRFNPVLYVENHRVFLEHVVPHEVAHLICWQLHGRVRPHGKEWASIMTDVFNLEPVVRHRFDTSNVTPQSFKYQCHCRQHELTLRRHNKVKRNQARYQCRHCLSELTPVV